MCIGELAQLIKRYDFGLLEREYVRMIQFKTASLMERSCQLGAVVGGASRETARHLAAYGLHFGIGFQIIDDCLDLTGNEDHVGKSLGTDIQKGKPTLPLIYLLRSISGREKKDLKAIMLESKDGKAVAEVRRLAHQHGALDRSLLVAEGYFKKAQRALKKVPNGRARQALADLADYTLSRKY